MIPATCQAGVVTADDVPVPAAVIQSKGVGASEGVLLIDGEEARYLPNTTPDIEETLEKISDALTTIANTLTAIGAGMTGPTTAPPPSLPSNVASLNATIAELEALKGALR